MVRIVLRVDLAGWTIELTSEPLPEHIGQLLMLELTRAPEVKVLSARIVREPGDALYKP